MSFSSGHDMAATRTKASEPNLREQLKDRLAQAKLIADTAVKEKREFTDAEADLIDKLQPEIEDLTKRVKKADEMDRVVKRLAGRDPDGKGYLDLAGGLGLAILEKMDEDGVGTKSLIGGGSIVTDVPVLPGDPVEAGHPLANLLSIIPAARRDAPTYRYLCQTQREMHAAPVAPGALKPTSNLTVESVDGKLHVIAHLSEPINKYTLLDSANLQVWVQTQLVAGLNEAIEDQVLNGDGTGENFNGLDHTTGVQQIEPGADPLATLAAAISALEVVGVAPAAFALSPADWLKISTTRNANGSFDMGGALDAAQRRAWGVPVTVCAAVTAGEGWLLGRNSCQVSTDTQGIAVEWGAPGDAFSRNQVVARVEGRFGFDVYAPHGVAKIDLTGTGTG